MNVSADFVVKMTYSSIKLANLASRSGIWPETRQFLKELCRKSYETDLRIHNQIETEKSEMKLWNQEKSYRIDKLFWFSRKSRVESSPLRSPILLGKKGASNDTDNSFEYVL